MDGSTASSFGRRDTLNTLRCQADEGSSRIVQTVSTVFKDRILLYRRVLAPVRFISLSVEVFSPRSPEITYIFVSCFSSEGAHLVRWRNRAADNFVIGTRRTDSLRPRVAWHPRRSLYSAVRMRTRVGGQESVSPACWYESLATILRLAGGDSAS